MKNGDDVSDFLVIIKKSESLHFPINSTPLELIKTNEQ